MFGMHMDWKAGRAAATNASAVTATGLLDSSSPLRSTGASPAADVAVQPVGDADLADTPQQGGSVAATSSIEAQATDTQQGGSSSSSGGNGSTEQGPDRMIIVAHLAEDLSWRVMTRLCCALPTREAQPHMSGPIVDCHADCRPQVADAAGRRTHSSLSVRAKSAAASAAVPARSAARVHIKHSAVCQTHEQWVAAVVEQWASTETYVNVDMQARRWTGRRGVPGMQLGTRGARPAPTCSSFTTTTTACQPPCCSCTAMSESLCALHSCRA